MADRTRTEMDAVAIEEFLESQETGVLAMADGDESYAVPLAFDYQPDSQSVYLRLGFGPGSQKRRFLEASDRVSFVVYDDTPEGWKSVVVEGVAERVTESSLDSTIREAIESIRIPYYRVHERPVSDAEFQIVRVDPVTLTGIVEG